MGGAYFYNFDEIPVNGCFPLTASALHRMFFNPANIPEDRIHLLDKTNYIGYDAYLKQAGGLDLVMMGLGTGRHFCGNLSTTVDDFGDGTRFVSNRCSPNIEARMASLSGGAQNMADGYVTFGPPHRYELPSDYHDRKRCAQGGNCGPRHFRKDRSAGAVFDSAASSRHYMDS